MSTFELKTYQQASQALQQVNELKTTVRNVANPINVETGKQSLVTAVEGLEQFFQTYCAGESWWERLYSSGYWVARGIDERTFQPMRILRSESHRLTRWLDEVEAEVKRVASEEGSHDVPRLVVDTSALMREGAFDHFDWSKEYKWAKPPRLVVPVLVVRELDDLKNRGDRTARKRLRRIYDVLEPPHRPAQLRSGATLELLMDPPYHIRAPKPDEEIIRRTLYFQGRPGGPLKLVTGDYTMFCLARAEGIDVSLTPAELTAGDEQVG